MTERRSFTQSLASFPLLQHVSFLSESGTHHDCPSWAKHPADGASAHPDGKQQPSLTTATSLGASLISLSVTPQPLRARRSRNPFRCNRLSLHGLFGELISR